MYHKKELNWPFCITKRNYYFHCLFSDQRWVVSFSLVETGRWTEPRKALTKSLISSPAVPWILMQVNLLYISWLFVTIRINLSPKYILVKYGERKSKHFFRRNSITFVLLYGWEDGGCVQLIICRSCGWSISLLPRVY